FAGTFPVTGTPISCAPVEGPYTVPTGTKSVDVAASADVPANDITIALLDPSGATVATSDVLFSPEAIHYEPGGDVAAGNYTVKVCPFSADATAFSATFDYHGTFAVNTATHVTSTGSTPKWAAFTSNPSLDYSAADTRAVWCWLPSLSAGTAADGNCTYAVANTASRAPWDYDFLTNQSTHTTIGNNAIDAEAWINYNDLALGANAVLGDFGPGLPGQRPVHADRQYIDSWTNAWFTNSCNPTTLVPGGND